MDRKNDVWGLMLGHSLRGLLVWSLLFVLLAVVLLVIMKTDFDQYLLLVREGAATERLSAVFYLVSGILMVIVGIKDWRRDKSLRGVALVILMGLFFIFIGGEEESWGQWIFKFDSPEKIAAVNYQNEVNLHNMELFRGLSAHRVLNAFVLLVLIVTPTAYRYSQAVRKFLNKLSFPVSPFALAGWFTLSLVYEKVAYAMHDHWAHTEAMEFLFSIGILVYGVSVFRRKNILPNTLPSIHPEGSG